tara:strand:+ start:3469 stop:4512 length:1044 start_codon:yes stop_codon:yes gene_type:complete
MFTEIEFNKLSNRLTFTISDLDLSIINGIRRILLSEIPIVGFVGEGIELSIKIDKNTTPLNNEIIENRISMIPIYLSDTDTEKFGNEDGIQKFEIKLNKTTKEIIENIYTKDFEVFIDDKKVKTIDYFPANPISKDHILITRLRKSENLELTATALKKTAKLNASFNPVTGCTLYYKYTEVSDNPIENERNYETNENGDPKEVKFSFEVINKLTHKYLFEKAINIIIDKLYKLKTLTENDIEIQSFNTHSFDFIIYDEDDTLGNIIQSYIHDNYVITNKKIFNNSECIFAGYLNVHPLQNILKIRLSLQNIDDEHEYKTFLGSVCDEIIKLLNDVITNWKEVNIDNI